MAPLPVTLSDVKCHLLFETFVTSTPRAIEHALYTKCLGYTWIRKHTWLVMSTAFLKTMDFSRSQAVTCTTNRLCLYLLNGERWYRYYRPLMQRYIWPTNSSNSDNLEWPSRSFNYCTPLQMCLRTAVQHIKWYNELCGLYFYYHDIVLKVHM